MARKFLVSRIALAVALSTGVAVTMAPQAAFAAKKKKQEGGGNSEAFVAAAVPIQEAINAGVTGISGQPTAADYAAAKQRADTQLGGDVKAALMAAKAAASTPADKLSLGDMMRIYGTLSQDTALKIEGFGLMLGSGALAADKLGQINFEAGAAAYNAKDYATAATYLQAAKDASFQHPQLDAVLADSYKRTGNTDAAMATIEQELAAAEANGTKPSEGAIRGALQTAYDAKNLADATKYAAMLARWYPTKKGWNDSLMVVDRMADLRGKDAVDIGRLRMETDSFTQDYEYMMYIDALNEVGYAQEALNVIKAGRAAGLLTETTENNAREGRANVRLRKDQSQKLVAGYERDAGAPGAAATTLVNAGDTMLSYDRNSEAETFYTRALEKGGVDASAVRLHLGIAQARQGKYAEAAVNFEQVTGAKAPLGRMWGAYAKSKTGAAAAAPAADTAS